MTIFINSDKKKIQIVNIQSIDLNALNRKWMKMIKELFDTGQPVHHVSGESIWTLARQSDLPNEPLLPIVTPPRSCKVQGTVNRPSTARFPKTLRFIRLKIKISLFTGLVEKPTTGIEIGQRCCCWWIIWFLTFWRVKGLLYGRGVDLESVSLHEVWR